MMKIDHIKSHLVGAAALILFWHSHALASDQVGTQRQELGGVAVEFQFNPPAKDGVTLDRESALSGMAQLRFSDATSGRPFAGVRPAAWIQARRSQQVAAEQSCEDKARQFAGSSLGTRADIDLNTYRLVTLNHDDTIAFINPFVGLQNSKLESIVPLPSRGYDWMLAPGSQRLFVSLRDADAVAVLDTVSRKLLKTIHLPAGSRPTRMALHSDGHGIWVGLDGGHEVALLNSADMTESIRLPVGRGLHTLESVEDQPWLFVSNTEDDTVTIIDRDRTQRVTDVPVSKTPIAMGWSVAAQRLVVVGANGGQMELIDPASSRVTARIPLAPGVVHLGLFDQGRYALAVNQLQSRVILVDLAAAKVLAGLDVANKPDQIVFTRDYAYVRGQGTAAMSVINLEEARHGRLQAVSVQMGQSAPEIAADSINVASVMAPLPDGNSMVMANAPDQVIYQYAAGMMVPSGSFSNYQRKARGLLVLDSSLSEIRTGTFTAPATFQTGGLFDVIVKTKNPVVTVCFPLTVAGPAHDRHRERSPALAGTLKTVSASGKEGRRTILITLTDREGRPTAGITDVMLLAVQQQGTWQQRVRTIEQGDGCYEAQLAFPESGEFELLLSVPSQRLGFTAGRLGRIRLPEASISSAQASARETGPHAIP